jgi:pimeloyl-ACP methyl ester carboxylesterase
MSRSFVLGAGLFVGALAGAAAMLVRRYRRDLRAAEDRCAATERKVLNTGFGDIEYVDSGTGQPVFVSHGIFQSCEGALLFRDLVPDRRFIAPSRFGYVGSSLPPEATPADQADAFVALLDSLGIIQVDVIGISAGATSVLQLALRHPARVKHLVVLSGNFPGAGTAVVQPSWAHLLNRQVPIWTLNAFAPSTMAFLAGVPRRFRMNSDEALFVKRFIDSLFPLTPMVPGVDFDAFVSNADVNSYDLEAITVPTLVVHSKDDPLVSYDAAKRAAGRIRGARLVALESGGHLMLGQTDTVRAELASFFAPQAVA